MDKLGIWVGGWGGAWQGSSFKRLCICSSDFWRRKSRILLIF